MKGITPMLLQEVRLMPDLFKLFMKTYHWKGSRKRHYEFWKKAFLHLGTPMWYPNIRMNFNIIFVRNCNFRSAYEENKKKYKK